MSHIIVVHYHEIGLKGRNRAFFEKALVRNLRRVTARWPSTIEVERGRIVMHLEREPEEAMLEALGGVFGVANYAPALQVEASVEAMTRAGLQAMSAAKYETFAVAARRATKQLPLTSQDINVQVGAAIQQATGAGVNLRSPDVTVRIEVVGNRALVYADRRRGPGGLPVGVSGRVMVLLSGGIDSPVAAYRLLKRGATASLCHFHSHPFTDKASVRKARELAGTIASWQGPSTLYLVAFGNAQQQIVVATPPALRVVLYRRFMFRVAGELAGLEGAKALVSGDSLGQVASQTLENMIAVEDAASIPVLRPLVGDDKQEIIELAKRIGTYETSILPFEDCCSLFVPSSPATRASVAACREAEERLDVEAMVAELVAGAEVERIGA